MEVTSLDHLGQHLGHGIEPFGRLAHVGQALVIQEQLLNLDSTGKVMPKAAKKAVKHRLIGC